MYPHLMRTPIITILILLNGQLLLGQSSKSKGQQDVDSTSLRALHWNYGLGVGFIGTKLKAGNTRLSSELFGSETVSDANGAIRFQNGLHNHAQIFTEVAIAKSQYRNRILLSIGYHRFHTFSQEVVPTLRYTGGMGTINLGFQRHAFRPKSKNWTPIGQLGLSMHKILKKGSGIMPNQPTRDLGLGFFVGLGARFGNWQLDIQKIYENGLQKLMENQMRFQSLKCSLRCFLDPYPDRNIPSK